MSNRHRKRSQKPNIQQFIGQKRLEISKAFSRPMKISVIARDPENPEAFVIVSDDSHEGLIGLLLMLQRQKDIDSKGDA